MRMLLLASKSLLKDQNKGSQKQQQQLQQSGIQNCATNQPNGSSNNGSSNKAGVFGSVIKIESQNPQLTNQLKKNLSMQQGDQYWSLLNYLFFELFHFFCCLVVGTPGGYSKIKYWNMCRLKSFLDLKKKCFSNFRNIFFL